MDTDNSPTILSQSQSHPVRVKLDSSTHKNLESQPRLRILHDFVSKNTASSPPLPPNPVVARGAGPTVGDEKGRYNYRGHPRDLNGRRSTHLKQPLRARGSFHGVFCSGELDANRELLSWVSLSLSLNDCPRSTLFGNPLQLSLFSSILFDFPFSFLLVEEVVVVYPDTRLLFYERVDLCLRAKYCDGVRSISPLLYIFNHLALDSRTFLAFWVLCDF